MNIMEIALALRFSGTKLAAIVDPIDINTPCEKAESTRATSKTPILVALAAMLLPIIKIIIIQSNKDLRDILDVTDVRIGAPKVTPKAYKETVNPAVETETCKSWDISGNSPTLINSVVPMANALTANASNANVLRFLSKVIFSPPNHCFNLCKQTI
ncbi:hypothetical protein B4119_0911 [Parageobacillus caldoxylosilyticus]|uniref:Uncharacterized protein n=1 Tax=Saccharococcus caldoxylosilyticus TaxID=81408 RepID=A0A150LGN2_9BACL|nr:hypothetical protein B4119_0911 [Parageobacillus caldoxylosilyticus]